MTSSIADVSKKKSRGSLIFMSSDVKDVMYNSAKCQVIWARKKEQRFYEGSRESNASPAIYGTKIPSFVELMNTVAKEQYFAW